MSYKRNISRGLKLKYGYYQFFDHFLGRERFFRWTKGGRKRFYDKLEKQLKASGPGVEREVDRVKELSYSDFKNKYFNRGIPVVIEGRAKDWPCVRDWSLDYFKELHGTDEIINMDQTDIAKGYEVTTLANVIDDIRGGGGKYYRFYPLLKKHPEHLNDIDYDWLRSWRVRKTWGEAFHVFIGGQGSFTPLHNASTPNLFVQAWGEKEWRLYPNYYAPVIDPAPARNFYRSAPVRNGVDFNPFTRNFEDYPLYEYIDSYKVHLKPGDVFFNPSYMWHAVQNPTDSIGFGYRTFTPFYAWKLSPLYMFLELFTFRPPIWVSYRKYSDVNLLHMIETGEIKKLEKDRGSKITSSVS